jgi:hypothetical protein
VIGTPNDSVTSSSSGSYSTQSASADRRPLQRRGTLNVYTEEFDKAMHRDDLLQMIENAGFGAV